MKKNAFLLTFALLIAAGCGELRQSSQISAPQPIKNLSSQPQVEPLKKPIASLTPISPLRSSPASAPKPIPVPVPTPVPTPVPAPVPQPTTENYTIIADDSAAMPPLLNVKKGDQINITFQVKNSNVYYGGLDFRSAVINSGTIYSGNSKTITFTANNSFLFTPYWPASNIAKGYNISVNVN